MPACIFRRCLLNLMRYGLLGLLLLALGGCGQDPSSTPGDSPAATPPTATDPSGDAVNRSPDAPAAPLESTIDWTLVEKEPWVSILGNWDQVVEADYQCWQQGNDTAASRCRDLVRSLTFGVTEAQINEAVAAADAALPSLRSVWSDTFERMGRSFRLPTAVYFGRQAQGGGVFLPRERQVPPCQRRLDNALYCPADNSIHFDEVFLAKVLQAVQKVTGTTGRYAVAAVAAHEMGHAASIQTGAAGGDFPKEELLADCFAGATIAVLVRAQPSPSKATQVLREATPLSEGQVGLLLLGGPKAVGNHAEGRVRSEYYTKGFNLGVSACAPETFGAASPAAR